MTYGSNAQGEATFTLSQSEHEAFKRGETIIKHTGDSRGEATITLRMARIERSRLNRTVVVNEIHHDTDRIVVTDQTGEKCIYRIDNLLEHVLAINGEHLSLRTGAVEPGDVLTLPPSL